MWRRKVQEDAGALEATRRDAHRFRELGSAHAAGHEQQGDEAAGIRLGSVIPHGVRSSRMLLVAGSRCPSVRGNR